MASTPAANVAGVAPAIGVVVRARRPGTLPAAPASGDGGDRSCRRCGVGRVGGAPVAQEQGVVRVQDPTNVIGRAGEPAGPWAIRPASPPASSGATVRHSSSTASAACSAPNSDGPPSQSTRPRPRRASSASRTSGVSRGSTTTSPPASVIAARRTGGRRLQRQDQWWHHGVGEECAARVELRRSRDDRDRWRGVAAARRALHAVVLLRAHGAGPDEDHLGQLPQQVEHLLVRRVPQAAGPPVDRHRAVQARHEVDPDVGHRARLGPGVVRGERPRRRDRGRTAAATDDARASFQHLFRRCRGLPSAP